MTRTDPEALAFAQHDHGACAADALDYARGVCEQQGLRLTPVRERVLQLLLKSHNALGAYDLLEKLKPGGKLVMPVGEIFADQQLKVIERTDNGFIERDVLPVRFVPVTSEVR